MHQDAWPAVQNYLQTQVGADDYASWLAPLGFVAMAEEKITLSVPTRFMQDWIEENYTALLIKAFAEAGLEKASITYQVAPVMEALKEPKKLFDEPNTAEKTEDAPKESDVLGGVRLDPRYTFDAFVTGKSNQFGYEAAKRIASGGEEGFNPFFLYGGVGLGKTHLMHAIGWQVLAEKPDVSVLYVSAEQFLYRFIRALQDKNTLSFKETFRTVDILMIDDIQFLAGKGATQEEFFHTFNALVSMGKQVILTADRSPHDLDRVEDRLQSRLGSGLTCEIHPPEVETRLAILQKKSEIMGLDLPQEVAMFMATYIASNVRELEGALNRLAAHSKLVGSAMTVEFAQEQLKDLFRVSARVVSVDDIQQKVAAFYTIKISDIHGPRRNKEVSQPRQVAMYLCKKMTTRSFPEIGRAFGGRDHTTVIHGTKVIEKRILEDATLAEEIGLIEKSLRR